MQTEYRQYVESFIKQGFIPMTYADWQKAKEAEESLPGQPDGFND